MSLPFQASAARRSWQGIHASTQAIALVGIVLIVGVMLAGLFLQTHLRDAKMVGWYHQASAMSRLLSHQSLGAVGEAIQVLDRVSQHLETHGFLHDPEKIHLPGTQDELAADLVDVLAGVPQAAAVYVLAPNGTLWAGVEQGHVVLSGNYAERDFFRAQLTPSQELFFGAPELHHGQDWFHLSRALHNEKGQTVGVVAIALSSRYFLDMFEIAAPGPGSAMTLLRSDYVPLVRYVAPERTAAPTASAGNPRPYFSRDGIADDGRPGVHFIETSDHTRLVAWQPLTGTPLLLHMTIPDTIFLKDWGDKVRMLRLAQWVVVVALAAVFYRLYRGFRSREREVEAAVALRKQAEDNAEDLRLAASVFDSTLESILILDRMRVIQSVNPAFSTMTGYQFDDVVGRSPRFLESGQQGTAFYRMMWRSLLRHGSWQGAIWITTKAGDMLHSWHTITAIRDSHGKILRLVSVFNDSSRRLAAERALVEKTEALARSNADLEQFAYVASHDLREPLRMICSYLALIERRYTAVLDDDGREFIGYARDGAARMDKLILDLLDYSRVGRSGRPVGVVLLSELVRGVIDSLRLRVAETRAIVTFPDDLPTVRGNEPELIRLFLNLIGNALKYHNPDRQPRVEIGWNPAENGMAHLWVRDNGIGIPKDQTERIFLIFQRLHSRQDFEGTGIGLAICRKIVDGHGGRLWVESDLGEGATFHITLARL